MIKIKSVSIEPEGVFVSFYDGKVEIYNADFINWKCPDGRVIDLIQLMQDKHPEFYIKKEA